MTHTTKHWKLVLTAALVLIGFGGCDSTISDDGAVSVKAGSTKSESETLGTLSLDREAITKLLTFSPWHSIRADIGAFYENQNYPQRLRTYTVDIRFGKSEVTAYADCKKITARYKVDGKKLIFSHVSTPAPAVELASCEESVFADEAVLALFENSFNVTSIDTHRAKLYNEDFDTTIELRR